MDITELLAFSAKQGASDLHLSAGLPPMCRSATGNKCPYR
jgi:twitching motility protein PilT